MLETGEPRPSHVKVFNLPETEVIVYLDADLEDLEFYLMVVTYIEGKTLTSENVYPSFMSLWEAFTSFNEIDAKHYYHNCRMTKNSVPLRSTMEGIKAMDFDTFCDWAEQQMPENLATFYTMMQSEKMEDQLQVLRYYMKKNNIPVV